MHTVGVRAGCTEAAPWQKVEMLMSPVGEGHPGMPKSVLGGALCSYQRRGAVQASKKSLNALKRETLDSFLVTPALQQFSTGCLVTGCL